MAGPPAGPTRPAPPLARKSSAQEPGDAEVELALDHAGHAVGGLGGDREPGHELGAGARAISSSAAVTQRDAVDSWTRYRVPICASSSPSTKRSRSTARRRSSS